MIFLCVYIGNEIFELKMGQCAMDKDKDKDIDYNFYGSRMDYTSS